MFVLLGFLLLFSETAWSSSANSCSTVDLRRTRGGQVIGHPRNQGAMGWCSPFSMADFISYYTGRKISALGVAINWSHRYQGEIVRMRRRLNDEVPALQPAGISNQAALYEGVRNRFQCLESDLPSDDNRPGQLRASLEAVINLKRQYDRTGQCSPPGIRTIQQVFPRLQGPQILRILDHSQIQDLHQNLQSSNCRNNNISLPRWRLQTSTQWTKVDEKLNSGWPLIVSYNANVLRNPANREGRVNHASLIVGRRMRGGKCEYLVRNSWGRSCGYYHPTLPCEQGHVWIPRDSLQRNSRDVTFLP